MMELAWYVALAAGCALGIANWRMGLMFAICVDALRDPVRKLAADEPIAITLSGAGLWLVIAICAWLKERAEYTRLFDRYPQMATMIQCLLIALLPAAAMSCLLFNNGYKLAIVGLVSYLAPILGIGVGYLFARSEREIYRLFALYSVVNGLLLVGVPLEFMEYDIPGLGGLKDMEWIRYRTGYTVNLIGGFYRSPDIMGLHAAHVVMFSVMLSLRSHSFGTWGWAGAAVWAAFCVMLSGRRKMIGIPLVFLAAYLALGVVLGVRRTSALLSFMIVVVLVGIAVAVTVLDEGDNTEYVEYAGTIFTEGAGRANDMIVGSSLSTMQQVGLLGAGLGTATQGRYYVGVSTPRWARGWQEDSVSRVIMEFGIPGTLLILASMIAFARALMQALVLVDATSSVQLLQIGVVSVLIANLASFVISHQQFSGDPISGLLALMMAGMVLGSPRIYAMRRRASAPPVVQAPAHEEAVVAT